MQLQSELDTLSKEFTDKLNVIMNKYLTDKEGLTVIIGKDNKIGFVIDAYAINEPALS
jgi:hypothetical protein